MIEGFDEAHALIVRPIDDGFQIVSGHNRALAATKAGLTEAPCWSARCQTKTPNGARPLNNAQGELTPLEVGLHAIGSGMTQRDYASKIWLSPSALQFRWQAASVASSCIDINASLSDRWSQLSAIHAAPEWLWRALVSAMVEGEWTVETTRVSGDARARNPARD